MSLFLENGGGGGGNTKNLVSKLDDKKHRIEEEVRYFIHFDRWIFWPFMVSSL
jgi:hypothetical protein